MNVPNDLKYTKDHEWVKIEDGIATVGVTDFAQGELGDIVYVEVETVDEELDREEVFGTVEAVKTVSDLFMPISGEVVDVNGCSYDQRDDDEDGDEASRAKHRSELRQLMNAFVEREGAPMNRAPAPRQQR